MFFMTRPFGDRRTTPIVPPCRIGWNSRNQGQPKKPRPPIATPHTLSFLNLSYTKVPGQRARAKPAHCRECKSPKERRSDSILASSLALLPVRVVVEADHQRVTTTRTGRPRRKIFHQKADPATKGGVDKTR